jgi:hypothetical protein
MLSDSLHFCPHCRQEIMITSASPPLHVSRCDHQWDLTVVPAYCTKCLRIWQAGDEATMRWIAEQA